MLSKGQFIFIIGVTLVFVGTLVVSYRKDRSRYKKQYSGVVWIVVGFLVFLALLFFLKTALKTP